MSQRVTDADSDPDYDPNYDPGWYKKYLEKEEQKREAKRRVYLDFLKSADPTTVTVVDFTDMGLEKLPGELLQKFKNLEELHAPGNKLRRLPSGIIRRMTQLRVITLWPGNDGMKVPFREVNKHGTRSIQAYFKEFAKDFPSIDAMARVLGD